MKAVIFIDVQNDFVTGALRNEKAISVVPKIVDFAKECSECSGTKLYATRDTHEKNYLATLEGQKLPVEHCIEGTDGWQIVTELMDVLNGKCTFVNKPTFGSYDLVEIIREDNGNYAFEKLDDGNFMGHKQEPIDEIVLCGFCTSICVAANAILLRAAFPNIKITVMKDLCACVTEESHNAALKVLEMQQIEVK